MTGNTLVRPVAFRKQLTLTLPAVAAAVLLPQLFHLMGQLSGLGTAPGETFLPMHLPVLFIGLYAGPWAGVLTGLLAPLVSFWLSGMPVAAVLPFMMVELTGYGLAAGLLRGVRMPALLKVVTAQVAGRVLRALTLLLAVYVFGCTDLALSSIWTSLGTGIWGLALQWSLLPLLLHRVKSDDR